MARVRAVLFDLDGTLADTEHAHLAAFNQAFADEGLDWHWDLPMYTRLLEVSGGKERIAQGATVVASIVSSLLGYGNAGGHIASGVSKFALLAYSRDDEKEADLVGLDLGARAGYDPRAGVTLWQKMASAGGGSPPAILSTHPSGPQRIQDIEARLPQVLPLYEAAGKPSRQFGPPAKLAPAKRDGNSR